MNFFHVEVLFALYIIVIIFNTDLTPGRATALTPRSGAVAVLGTPGNVAHTPGPTPLRDKLNINPEEGLNFDESLNNKQLQQELKEQLKKGLASLPTPKNDYEIVIPEDEQLITNGSTKDDENLLPDASDLDIQKEEEIKKQST